jgi:hypothetical protein
MLRKTILCLTLLSVFVLAARGAEQPSVYIEESQSWTVNDWILFTGLLGALGGGSRPQTIEIIHTFTKRCPQLAPTREREGVDFVVVLEREGGKSIFRKDNKYAVFTGAGDLVEVGSTHMASTAVSQACEAIMAKETGKAINRVGVAAFVGHGMPLRMRWWVTHLFVARPFRLPRPHSCGRRAA